MVGSVDDAPPSLRMNMASGFPPVVRCPPAPSIFADVQPPPVPLLGTKVSKVPLVIRLAGAAVTLPSRIAATPSTTSPLRPYMMNPPPREALRTLRIAPHRVGGCHSEKNARLGVCRLSRCHIGTLGERRRVDRGA